MMERERIVLMLKNELEDLFLGAFEGKSLYITPTQLTLFTKYILKESVKEKRGRHFLQVRY